MLEHVNNYLILSIMFSLISSFYRKRQYKKVLNHVKSSTTQLGSILEVRPHTHVTLHGGSTKDDIIIHNNVMLLGCSLFSIHHGKIIIGNNTKLGEGSKILCVDKVTIGDYTAIATDVTIVDNNNHPINPVFRQYMRTTPHNSDTRSWIHSDHKPVVIGRNCWIGSDVRIQKGVTIGDNAIIAACSVVTKDVPANCIAAGNPAKIVKTDIDKIPAPVSCKEFNDFLAKNE